MSRPSRRRWTGWASRKPSVLRPFPALALEQLETRETPATLTWTGGGGPGNTNWTLAANWLGGAVPTGAAAASEDLVFPAGAANFTSNNNLTGAVFNSIAFSGGGYTLSGNAVTLGTGTTGSGDLVAGAGTQANVISFPIALNGPSGTDQTFTINSGADLTLSGAVSGNTGSAFVKDGAGNLILTANNTNFTGNIRLVNAGGTLTIRNVNALGSTAGDTTVGTGATLAVDTVAGAIPETLRLNGPGLANVGAVLNLAGNNTWAGPVILDTDASMGATAGVLSITGQVSDTGAGRSLTKEGAGEVQFNSATGNTYRGLTTVNHGTLTISHPLALGSADTTPATGTLVNRTLTGAGQLRLAGAAAGGMRILNERLTLNGPGSDNLGAFHNLNGDNTWAGPVLLGSPSPNGFSVSIGAAAATNLTISGVVSSPNLSGQTLTKVAPGRLILNNANTYDWSTVVAGGALNVRDSNALGTTGAGTTVQNGAALELEVEAANPTTVPRFDAQGVPLVNRDLWADSVTNDANKLTFGEPLNISGRGISNTGALRSISGINIWSVLITLGTGNVDAAVGVDSDLRPGHPTADASYFVSDYSLTAAGSIGSPSGTNLVKRNTGHLILPVANNIRVNSINQAGQVLIEQGWTTIQNNNAFGFRETQLGDTVQPATFVSSGAAVHLKPLTPTSPPLVVPEIITLAGVGPTHPYTLIGQKGALLNIGGDNTWTGDVFLNGVAGIGAEQVAPTSPLSPPAVVSELTINGAMRNSGATAGGITKLGSRRLSLQNEGTYTGANTVQEGTLRVQSDTALGRASSGTFTGQQTFTQTSTTVATGAVLEFRAGVSQFTGGIAAGVQVYNEQLILNAPAQQVLVAGALGTFSLTYTHNASGATEATPQLPLSTTAAQLQAALVALPNLAAHAGSITVTKTGGTFTIVYGNATSAELNFDKLSWQAVNGAEVVVSGGLASVVNLTDDNAWRGPVTLNAGTRISTAAGTRLSLLGSVSETTGAAAALVKRGPGELLLGATNTYTGPTRIDRGVATALSSGAFGTPAGGTTVATGAQINLQGGVTIAGEGLGVTGTGWTASQLLSLAGTAGTFTLTFLGQVTAPIPFNATAAQVQAALEILPAVTNPPEVQLVQLSGTTGSFTLTFNGQTTATIAANATAATIQTQFQALSTVGAGNALVFRNGNTIVIVFAGALAAANQPQTTANAIAGSGLTLNYSTSVEGGGTGTVSVANDASVATTGTKLIVTFGGSLSSATLPLAVVANSGGAAAAIDSQTIPLTAQRWFSTGPAPTNQGQSPQNLPTSGRITSIVTDYTDPNTIYVATAGGGAWKTKNGGLTWLPLFDGPTAPPTANMFGGSIAIHPTDPRIVYFATGESNGAVNGLFPLNSPQDNYAGTGVYRSNDSGLTWTLLTGTGGNPIAGQAVTKIVVSAADVLFAATSTRNVLNSVPSAVPGIYRWDGANWFNMTASVSAARANTPGQAPFDPPTAGGTGLGPPRTPGPDDDYRLNFPQTNATWSDVALVGGTLYAALGESQQANGNFATLNGIYRTTSVGAGITQPVWLAGGGTAGGVDGRTASQNLFGDVANGPPRNGYIKLAGAVTPGTGVIVVHAVITITNPATGNPDSLLDVQRTGDGGVTWGATGAALPNDLFGTVPAGQRAMGRYNIAIAVRDLDPRGVNVNTPLPGNIPDNVPDTVYVAGFDRIFTTANGGGAWTQVPLDAANAYPARQYHALHLDMNNRLLSGSDGGIWRLDNTTATFANLNGTLGITQLNSVDPHPTDPNRAVGGAADNATQIFNNSQAWTRTDTDPAANPNLINTSGVVRYDPSNPNVIYAVRDGVLRRSLNGGTSWATVRTVPNVGNITNYYFPLVVDRQQPNRILIGGADGLQVSTSRGDVGTYINLNAGISPTAIALATFQGQFVADPSFLLVTDQLSNTYDQDTIYVTDGTSLRVTKNRGLSWVTRTPTFSELNYTITFVDGLDNTDVPQITAVGNGPFPFPLTTTNGNPTASLPLRNEVQSVNVTGTNGTFTLTFNGQTTPDLPFNATPAQVATALNALTSISGVSRQEIQLITVAGGTAGTDTFTLTINGTPTAPILVGATAATVQAALNAVYAPGVVVTGAAGGPYTVTYNNLLNQTQITGTGSVAAVVVTGQTLRNGGPGRVTVGAGTPIGGAQIKDIAVDPSNRDVAYAVFTFSRGQGGPTVFRTTDGGRTWADISGVGAAAVPPIPTSKVVIDPRSGILYVGNDDGVWSLPDARNATVQSAVWSQFGAGMPRVQVRDLQLNQSLNTLTAGTSRGAFQLFLPTYEVASGAVRAVSGANVWTGPVQLTGATSLGADGTQQIQNGIAAASVNYLGTISDGPGGPFTLTKTGAGTVTLSGTNTYAGQTLVREGVLQVNNPRALGAATPAGNTIVIPTQQNPTRPNPAAALELRSDLELEPVVLNGNGFLFNNHFTGAMRNVAGANTYTGPLTLNTNTTLGVDSGTTLTIGAKTGLSGNGSITDGAATLGFDKEGLGTLVLANANAHDGLTRVVQGAIQLQHALGLGTPGVGTTVLDGAALQLATPTSGPFAGTPVVVASEPLLLSGTGAANTGALRNTSGSNTYSGPITLTIAPNFSPPSNPGSQIAFGVDGANDNLTIASAITENNVPGAYLAQFGIIKVGAGRMTLTAANRYNGVTTVRGGTLRVQNPNALGPVVSSEVQTLNVVGTTGTYQLSINGQTTTPAFAATASAATVQAGLNALTSLSQNEIQTLTVAGAGTFTLTFNGATTGDIATGATAATVQAALEALGTIGIGNVTVAGPDGGPYTITFQGQLASFGWPPITGGGAGVTVTTASAQRGAGVRVSETPTLNGKILTVSFSGAAGVGDTDVPLLTPTNVSAVLLVVPATAQTGGLGTVVEAGAALELDGSGGPLTLNEVLSISGNGVGGAGALTNSAGTNAYAGPITLAADAGLGAAAGSTLVVLGTLLDPTPLTVPAPRLTKGGQGTVVFPTANAYGGQTVVNDGVLRILDPQSLGGLGRNEQQYIYTYGTGGTFTLSYNGQTTAALANGATAAQVQTALNALTNSGRQEIQLVQVTGPAAGSFTLTFNGQTTAPISLATMTAANVQAALNALTNFQGGAVVGSTPVAGGLLFTVGFSGLVANANQPQMTATPVGGAAVAISTAQNGEPGGILVDRITVPGGFRYEVLFGGALARTNVNPITATPAGGLRVSTITNRDGTGPEVQTVQVIASNGTYSLRFNGQTTVPIDFDAPPARVQTALNALSSVGRPEIQQVQVTGAAGTFTLTFNGQTTAALPFNETAANVQAALNGLSTIGGLDGSVVVTASTVGATTTYTITFRTALDNADQPLVVAAGTGGATTAVVPVQDGGGVFVTGVPVGGGQLFTVQFLGYLGIRDQQPITLAATTGAPVVSFATVQDGQQGTVVNSGGTLQVSGGFTMQNELVTLNGAGFNGQGALNNFSGNNVWAAPLTLGSNASIGTTNAAETLAITQPITDNGSVFGVDIVGPGTVIYTALVDNQYTGTTTVRAGTLLLSQPTGVAIVGPLVVGVAGGGPATVRETQDNQIGNTVPVVVNGPGLFDLNGKTDTIGNLGVNGGTVLTGTGGNLTTGTVTMTGGQITVGNSGKMTSGNVQITTGTITVGLGTLGEFTANNVLINTGTIAGGAGSKVTTADLTATNGNVSVGANGVLTMGVVNTTNGTVSVGNGGTLLTGNLTENGTTITTGTDTTVTTGNVNMTGGSLTIGNNTGAPNELVALGNVAMTGGSVAIGNDRPLSIGNVSVGTGTFGVGTGATGTVGNVGVTTGSFAVGAGANPLALGNLTVGAGAATFGSGATLATGAVSVAGGTVQFGDTSTVGVGGGITATAGGAVSFGATDTFSAGNLVLNTGTLTLGAGTVGAVTGITTTAGTVNLTGAATQLLLNGDLASNGADRINGPGTLDLGGTTRTFTVADAAGDVDLGISAVVAGAGAGLVKTGAGRLELTAVETFTGPLTINAGDVRVDGTVGAVQLGGGTLSGVGTVGAIGGTSATVPGTVNPGDNGAATGPFGILSATGPVVWGGGTTFFADLRHISAGAPVPGTDHDQLQVAGSIDLGGAVLAGSFGPGIVNADSFTLITAAGGVTGTFGNTSPTNTLFLSGHKFQVVYTANSVVLNKIRADVTVAVTSSFNPSTLGQDVVFTAQVTPEAGSGPIPTTGPGNAVTFQFGSFSSPPIQLDALGRAVYTPPDSALPGGTTAVGANFSGDDVDFNPGSATLAGGQTVLVPSIDPLAAFVDGTPAATPTYISPASSVGVLDSYRVTTTVRNEVTTSPTPQTWTVTVTGSGGPVWTTTQTAVIDTALFTFPVDATWNGTNSFLGGNVPDGTYTVTASFTDNEWGNTGTTPALTVTVDNTAPVVSPFTAFPAIIAPGSGSATVPTALTIQSTITEANLSGWTITVRNSAGATVRTFSGTTLGVNQAWDGRDDLGNLVPDDAYTVTLTATDLAGNSTTTPSSTVVVLKAAPTLTVTTASPVSYGTTIQFTATLTLPSLTTAGRAIAAPLLVGTTVGFRVDGTQIGTQTVSNVGGVLRAVFTAPRLDVGTYSIDATFAPPTNFLPTTSAAVQLQVTPQTLTLRANDATKVYGDAVPPLGYTLVSGLVPGDVLADQLTGGPGTTATQTSPVDAYVINQGTLASANYLIVFQNGTLTVTPRPLSITADNKSKGFAAPLPPLTYTVGNLAPFDNQLAVVTGELTTPATQSSPIGQYPIERGTVLANSNYAVTFTPGTLTITAPVIRITIDNARRQFGQPNPTFTAQYEGFLNGDGPSVVQGLNLTTTATQTSRARKYPIFSSTTPTAANYIVEVVEGTLTVTALPTDVVFGPGPNTPAGVQIFKPNGDFSYRLVSDTGGITGAQGIRTAGADFDGDGVTDVVLASGPGVATRVVVINGATRAQMFAIQPFESRFTGGLFVSTGDVNGDGIPDLAVSPDQGGGPRVLLFSGDGFGKIADYFGIDDPGFRGGARTAIGDFDGDGFADVATAAGFLGGPRVSIASGSELIAGRVTRLVADFFIFGGSDALTLRNGAFIAAGDINGDGFADLVGGGGPGGGPRVLAVDGRSLVKNGSDSLVPLANFFGGNPNNRGGVRLAVKDLDGDDRADLVIGAGEGDGTRTAWYRGLDLQGGNPAVLLSLDPFDAQGFLGGVFVG